MTTWPIVPVALALRCHYRELSTAASVCGAPASWQRAGAKGYPPDLFCDRHRGPQDLQVAPAPLLRRVRVTLVVDLAGSSFVPAHAHTEAVDTLVSALEAVGAQVSTVDVSSTVVQNPAPRPTGRENPAPAGQG